MIVLFVAVAAGVLFGTVLLWLSGYYTGQGVASGAISQSASETQTLQRLLESEQKKNREMQTQLKEVRKHKAAPPGPPKKSPPSRTPDAPEDDKDAEIARLTSENAKLEGERDKAQFELDNAQEELESLQEQLRNGRPSEKPTSLPKPDRRTAQPHSESEALDEIQAKLDMEKVSHQQTREDLDQVQKSRQQLSEQLTKTQRELEQIKKLAALQISSNNEKDRENTQTGSRFKTMAMGMRSPVAKGSDQKMLQEALEKTQTEKQRLEAELERAKKELQLAKVRS
ncbi:MAG: hypothetical protein JXR76_03095 [Deltaproteobacteria bacterium]|nr:hypothetical protein [Deltaproteobacteria bacterium]